MTELQMFSVDEAARNLSVSHWTLRLHIKRGGITVVRCGRRILMSRAEVERIAREGLPSLRQADGPRPQKMAAVRRPGKGAQ